MTSIGATCATYDHLKGRRGLMKAIRALFAWFLIKAVHTDLKIQWRLPIPAMGIARIFEENFQHGGRGEGGLENLGLQVYSSLETIQCGKTKWVTQHKNLLHSSQERKHEPLLKIVHKDWYTLIEQSHTLFKNACNMHWSSDYYSMQTDKTLYCYGFGVQCLKYIE